jgi:hypothetical protein
MVDTERVIPCLIAAPWVSSWLVGLEGCAVSRGDAVLTAHCGKTGVASCADVVGCGLWSRCLV